MFRSYDHHQLENILLARITQLTTDPLFYNIANIIVIVFYNQLR
jgi:Cdc6-like AAA superfamily ATPase